MTISCVYFSLKKNNKNTKMKYFPVEYKIQSK